MDWIVKSDQLAINLPNSLQSQVMTYHGKRIMSQFTKWTNKRVTVCISIYTLQNLLSNDSLNDRFFLASYMLSDH